MLQTQSQPTPSRFFLLKKNGYCVPVQRRVQVFNSLSKGFIYMCTIEPLKVELQAFILIDLTGKVEAISSSCISLLGIDLRFIAFRDTIDGLFTDFELESVVDKPVRKYLRDMYSADVVEKAGLSKEVLEGELEVRAERVGDAGWVVSFEAISQAPPQHPGHATMSSFQMNLDLSSIEAVPCYRGAQCEGGESEAAKIQPLLTLTEDINEILLE
jgi:hypothetical protein